MLPGTGSAQPDPKRIAADRRRADECPHHAVPGRIGRAPPAIQSLPHESASNRPSAVPATRIGGESPRTAGDRGRNFTRVSRTAHEFGRAHPRPRAPFAGVESETVRRREQPQIVA